MTTLTSAAAPPHDTTDVAIAPAPINRAQRRLLRQQSLLLPASGVSSQREPNRENPRLAVYKRRSKRRDESSSLARQDAECLEHIEKLGGIHDPERDTFSDDDITAKGGAYRPGMEALLRAIQDGRYDGIVVYEIPRALRNRGESLKFRQILTDAACDLYNVRFPVVSLYGPTAFVFDMLVDIAASEVEATSDRISSWHDFMSKLGAAHGPAPWGMTTRDSGVFVPGRSTSLRVYTPDTRKREELGGRSRADLLSEAVAKLLDGDSMRSIVTFWNEAGYPAPRQPSWSVASLSQLLRNPTLAGLVHYKGSLLDNDGKPVEPGSDTPPMRQGDPLLSDSTWERLSATVVRRAGEVRRRDAALLQGLLSCGTCGYGMSYQRLYEGERSHSSTNTYRCARNSSQGRGACSTGNNINADHLEALVVETIIGVLSDPAAHAAATEMNKPKAAKRVATLRARLGELNRRLRDIEDLWLDTPNKDNEARARFESRRKETEQDMAAAHRELAELTLRKERPNVSSLGTDVAASFASLPKQRKTNLMLELIDRIVIEHAQRTGPRWKPERVTIRWAQG